MISNKQLRAGRALLNFDQKEITDATGINVNQISAFERGMAGLSVKNINKLTEFFISSGIEFLPYDGVRFAPNGAIRSLSGREGLRELYDDIYKVAETVGGAIDIFNGLPKAIITNLGEDWYKSHIERMIKIKDRYCLRAIVQDGDQNFIGSEFASYKWWDSSSFQERMIYIYDSKVAFVSFEPSINIILINQTEIADSQRALFETAWSNAGNID